MTVDTEFTYSCRVYAEDTDFMGIVYHANYLRFLERARTELLTKIELPLSSLANYNYFFAIHQVQLQYLMPAKLDDLLRIKTVVSEIKRCSLTFNQTMHNQLHKIICKAEVKVIGMNKDFKIQRLPSRLLQYFEEKKWV